MSTPSSDKRPRLRDIVRGNIDDLQAAFDESVRTGGRTIVPAGSYKCLIVEGRLDKARTGTGTFKVVFAVVQGPHAGRRFYRDIWLTPKALRMSGHELAKLGFPSISELDERPLKTGLMADVKVVVNTDDDGTQRNRVTSFKVVDADVPADEYRPPADPHEERGEADAKRLDPAGRLDAHGFNFETSRYESATPLLDAKPNGRTRR
jgi:hypothetical protein